MTKVYTADYTLPSADMGEENPLPMFRYFRSDGDYEADAYFVPYGYDRIGYGWNTGGKTLPYREQDGYNRIKKEKTWFSVVLENDYIQAVLVPGMGGKIVKVYDKVLKRDLVLENPVYQPGNLAIRNAWTSGGIEYNFGHLGHHTQTCEPLHVSLVDTEMGKAVRVFTFDRMKLVSYHYDFCLPDDSKYLLCYVRLINNNDCEIPVYWWTNMAVPVYEGGRVIAPADSGYINKVVYKIAEGWKGSDLTYPKAVNHAYDVFFRLDKDGQRRWEVNADKDGLGLLYASTRRLIGRKLFTWGEGRGGVRWNEHLATKDTPVYLEVQGGLAYTQMHSAPMPKKTEWDWLEMYGGFEGSKEAVTCDWKKAYTITGEIVENVLPEKTIDDYFAIMQKTKDTKGKVIFAGQGWGALENYRAKVTGTESYIPESFDFAESDMTEKQALWKEFAETGILKEPKSTTEAPGEYMVQEEWFDMLKKSAEKDDNWFVNFHIGVCYMERQNYVNAKAYFEISNLKKENCWATYSLAIIDWFAGKKEQALKKMDQAYNLNPLCPQLAHFYFDLLLREEKYDVLDRCIAQMDPSLISFERIKMDIMRNALYKNDFATVEKYIYYDYATIQEAETAMSDIWFEMMARKRALKEGKEWTKEMTEEFVKLHDEDKVAEEEKLPYQFDFRMSEPGDFYEPPTQR